MGAPYHQDDTVTTYHGDALAVLANLPAESVDALVTDPPYSSGGMTRADRAGQSVKAKYVQTGSGSQGRLADFAGDNRDQRGYEYWCALWLSEALRAVKPGGAVCLFTDWRQLPVTTDIIQAGGFVWRGIVPWYKPGARPQVGKFTAACEYVVWGSRGVMATTKGTPVLPGFFQATAPREREHITQKPLDVMRQIVKIAPPGGTVLDPFMGSGTTGVAAVLEGRRFIGAEVVREFAQISTRRIRAAQGEAAPSPTQDALDLGEAS